MQRMMAQTFFMLAFFCFSHRPVCSKWKTHIHTLHYTCLVLHSGAQTLAKLNYNNSVISCRCWDVYIFLIISNANAHTCPLNVCNAEINISVGKRPSPHLTELNLLLRKGRPHLISDLNWQYTHAIVSLEDKRILISVHIWVFARGQKTWHLVTELLFFFNSHLELRRSSTLFLAIRKLLSYFCS